MYICWWHSCLEKTNTSVDTPKVQTPSAALNFTVPSAVATDKQDPGSCAIPATVSPHRGLRLGVTHITSQVPLARNRAFGHTKLQGRLELLVCLIALSFYLSCSKFSLTILLTDHFHFMVAVASQCSLRAILNSNLWKFFNWKKCCFKNSFSSGVLSLECSF